MQSLTVAESNACTDNEPKLKNTIEESLRAFLAAPPPIVSTIKASEKEGAIELLRSYVCYQGDRILSAKAPPRVKLASIDHKGFHQTCPAARLPALIPSFIAFLTREISPVASQQFVRNICMTVEELIIWLVKNNYVSIEEGEEAAFIASQAAKDLPRAMRALKRWQKAIALQQEGDILAGDESEAESYFVMRLAPSLVWLENNEGPVGPIKLDDKTRRELQVGWEIRCLPTRIKGSWHIRSLAGIFPQKKS